MIFNRLLFAVAGVPFSSLKQDAVSGIKRIAELGLDAMELEFVQGVKMKEEGAARVKDAAKSFGVVLTAHAPYFINLNSPEEQKLKNSRKHILDTAKILHLCGGVSFTFHPGFYLKSPADQVYQVVKKELTSLYQEIANLYPDLLVSPETTGKPSSFGSLEELLSLCSDIKGLNICIDFAHLHARTNGGFNTYEEFSGVFESIKKINPNILNQLHMHISGISYGVKGEIKHLPFQESDFNYRDFLKALICFKVKGILVCESPILEEDTVFLKNIYQEMLA